MKTATRHTTRLSTPTDCDIVMERTFEAPRARVYDAWTRPELLRRWWGPPEWTLPECEMNVRVGGTFRQVMARAPSEKSPTGHRMVLQGEYREVIPGERLVYTQRIEGCGGQGSAEAIVTLELSEHRNADGRMITALKTTTRYPSREVRDSALNSGATRIDEIYDRLADLLAAE